MSSQYVDTCEISGDVSDTSLANVKRHCVKAELINFLWIKTNYSHGSFCTTNQQMHTTISQIFTLLHVSALSCHRQAACNQYLAKLHQPATRTPHRNTNTHRTKNNTTNVIIQENSPKLLMMDILMSETCWAHKKWNKNSKWHQVGLLFSSVENYIYVTDYSSYWWLDTVPFLMKHKCQQIYYNHASDKWLIQNFRL